jgi:bacterioferritin-associated ferredoxin
MTRRQRDSGGPPRLVCRCVGVPSARIVDAARTEGCLDLAGIQEATGACTACGTCREEILEILADLRGEEVPARTRAQNELVCQRETERRIEGCLSSGVAPKLPPGGTAELVRVRGLEVVIRVEGPEQDLVRRMVAERLRKLVCDDLKVRFR